MAKRSKIRTSSLPKLQSFGLSLLFVLLLFVILWGLIAIVRTILSL